jgi:hypothetical protein
VIESAKSTPATLLEPFGKIAVLKGEGKRDDLKEAKTAGKRTVKTETTPESL